MTHRPSRAPARRPGSRGPLPGDRHEAVHLRLSERGRDRLDSLRGALSRPAYLEAVLEALDQADAARAITVLARLVDHHRT